MTVISFRRKLFYLFIEMFQRQGCRHVNIQEFKSTPNDINRNIQYTMEYRKEQLPFLDYMIQININDIIIDICQTINLKSIFSLAHVTRNTSKQIPPLIWRKGFAKQWLIELFEIFCKMSKQRYLKENIHPHLQLIELCVHRTLRGAKQYGTLSKTLIYIQHFPFTLHYVSRFFLVVPT